MSLLNDLGLGTFFNEKFLSVDIENVSTDVGPHQQGFMHVQGDAGFTVLADTPQDLEGGSIDLTTDNTDEDVVMINTQAFLQIVRNSGNKVWFETRVQISDITADYSFFAGLIEEDALNITDSPCVDEGVTPSDHDQVGFVVLSGDPNGVSAVSKEATVTTITHATTLANDVRYVAGGGTTADWPTNAVYKKLGMRFDGQTTMEWYLDGILVFSYPIATTLFPDDILMGVALCLKDHTGAGISFKVDWVAAAYQKRT